MTCAYPIIVKTAWWIDERHGIIWHPKAANENPYSAALQQGSGQSPVGAPASHPNNGSVPAGGDLHDP